MRIYLEQIGCRLNYSEMGNLAEQLAAAGHTLVTTPERAQVIVFNSCAVTADAVRSSRRAVRSLAEAAPGARIAVTGCWATLAPGAACSLPGVALVVDNEGKELLGTLLEGWSAELDDPEILAHLLPDGRPAFAAEVSTGGERRRTRAFVKVQDGCNLRCTFCVVTVARGRSRSRPVDAVVEEVRRLIDSGVQEVVLTGVHLGSYGRDLSGNEHRNLRDLVAALLADTPLRRLRLSSLEPWELADGFFDLWRRWPDRLCPHLHLPLQAGNDRQLRRMARRTTTGDFRRLVDEARAAIPDLILTTDLIVGFPGETDADFEAGLAFVAEMRFAHAHLFPFSARPETAAAGFDGQVAGAVRRERLRRLQAVVGCTGRDERLRFRGSVRPVLWEGRGRPLADGSSWLWSGLTDNYLRVQAAAPAGLDLHNVITPTRLAALKDDLYAGEIEHDSLRCVQMFECSNGKRLAGAPP